MIKEAIAEEAGSERRGSDRGARAKKDLRFNIVPTVIRASDNECLEISDQALSALVRESLICPAHLRRNHCSDSSGM
ncbi:hypothetical protein DPMN_141790 [Dreissena polymorpha]|uniref:Uncharacterized protein n=1 Tax=Dreissena polymorpha TaxID=45954 RepID=A0A9D4JIM2_DREPO|nr:hypothetical protein DPMN_141790 [Dreissena polymorpha]